MRRSVVSILAGVTLLAAATLPAVADYIPQVSPHQHFVKTASGQLVPVGPDACADGPSRQFDEFHGHVHVGAVGTFAMDHPHNRTDIVAVRTCPVSP